MTVKTVGSGDHVVVCLHGWFGSADGWGFWPEVADPDRYTWVFPEMRGYGARLKFSGVAGPINDSSAASFKRRNIDFDLSPAALNDILDAYLTDGDQAAVDALGRALAGEYMQTVNYGWQFASEAKAVDFLRHLT